MNHSDVVNLIKESGLQVQLTVSNPILANTNGNGVSMTNESYYGNNNNINSMNSYPLTP